MDKKETKNTENENQIETENTENEVKLTEVEELSKAAAGLKADLLKVRAENKKLKEQFDKEAKQAEAAKIEEEKNLEELKKLYKSKDQELEELRQSVVDNEVKSSIISEASKLDFSDPADAVVFLSAQHGKLGDIENVELAVKDLAERKPSLIKQPEIINPALGTTRSSKNPEVPDQEIDFDTQLVQAIKKRKGMI